MALILRFLPSRYFSDRSFCPIKRPGLLRHALVLLAAFVSNEVIGQQPQASPPQEVHPFHMNSLGFLPDAPKRVTIAVAGEPFKLVRVRDGEAVLIGKSSPAIRNKDTAEDLSLIDFSEFKEPGAYRLDVKGLGKSPEFNIAAGVFNQAFYTVFRGMYLARCGVAVAGEHGGRHYEHKACHLNDALTDFAEEEPTVRDANGGWHDAGDYNKYIVNAGITVGMMLQAWEHYQDRLADLNLDLPESRNEVPDFLDEIRWEMDWVLEMQLADGSVSHKVSTKRFGGFIAPEDEKAERYFVPWSSAATADFVAMTAASARIFKDFDPAFAERCLIAARKSYEFLVAHPGEHPADQREFSTGGYGAPDPDDRLWAAAELWEATGDETCLNDFESAVQKLTERSGDEPVVDFNWDWGDVSNLAMFTYVLSKREGRSLETLERVKQDIIKVADNAVAMAESHGYGRPLGDRYYWGCNGSVPRMAMVLEVAHRLQPNLRYKGAALAAIDHVFGRNYYGRSFVTGLGYKPPLNPHDRRNGINGFPEPWPGYLVGGPWPSAKDWRDNQDDFRTNEIAINWNGALIYALAGFVEPESFPKVASSQ